MRKTLWILMFVVITALCVTAHAEIALNEFPSTVEIPETYTLLSSEMPPFPRAEFTGEGTVLVSGLAAWDVSPEMMTDWALNDNSWIPDAPGLYDGQLVVTRIWRYNPETETNEMGNAVPNPGEGFVIPLKLTGDRTVEMILNVSADYEDPLKADLYLTFRDEEGTEADLREDGTLYITEQVETETDKRNTMLVYQGDGTLSFVESSVFDPAQRWYEKLGSYELRRVTDCITGERFDELIVTGNPDPESVPFRMAGEALPVRTRLTDKDPFAWGEEPALPVLDPLPDDGLPEEWPAEYPDACPSFSCEALNGVYVWTVESPLPWGARVNVGGETYADPELINYFYRSYTLDTVPDDRIRLVISDRHGTFEKRVETEQGPYEMSLKGDTRTDAEGNMTATLTLTLMIHDERDITLKYISDGTTQVKRITTSAGGRIVTGEYGEDNRLIK